MEDSPLLAIVFSKPWYVSVLCMKDYKVRERHSANHLSVVPLIETIKTEFPTHKVSDRTEMGAVQDGNRATMNSPHSLARGNGYRQRAQYPRSLP